MSGEEAVISQYQSFCVIPASQQRPLTPPRNSDDLLCGATTEQISTLIRVAEEGVDKNICVYENVGAGWEIFDQLRRHD